MPALLCEYSVAEATFDMILTMGGMRFNVMRYHNAKTP